MRGTGRIAARILVVVLGAAACSGGGSPGSPADADPPGSDAALPDVPGAGDALGGDRAGGDPFPEDPGDAVAAEAGGDPADAPVPDGDPADADAGAGDAPAAGDDLPAPDAPADVGPADAAPEAAGPRVHPPEHCAYFLTGEVDLEGTDADGDGTTNGWDHCPNNPYDWLDSDRDGIGNRSDPDLDGDGLLNPEDPDRDDDGADDAAEAAAGTDPADPSSIPGLRRFDVDMGVWNPSPGWYRTDLHVHSEYSHDSDSRLATYPPACATAGIHFMTITDHDVFDAPFDPAWVQDTCLMLAGMEWGGSGGHANQWGIRTFNDAVPDTPDNLRRAWRLARLQGGVQSLNHYGADMDTLGPLFVGAPDLFRALDVIEVWNSPWAFNSKANEPAIELWQALLNQGYRVGAVGGGDSHTPFLTLGSPTTVVWAESLSVPALLHGLRKGRTYITQADALSYDGRPELDFRIDSDGDGTFEGMLGDEVAPGQIELRIRVVNAKGPIVLIRNGAEIDRFQGHASGADVTYTTRDFAHAGDWYRVEMRESLLSFSPMRLFSSAIYVGK